MEDCLHTSSENLSKLVSWAHSHGTICNLIPSLKHLLSEGTHGNLTAMWGCSAGHAYHWPLAATCRAGSQERICFQDNRSFNSDSPSMIGVPSETQQSPVERFQGRLTKGKMDSSSRTRDSCDFSYGSEPSEVDETIEEYEDDATLFDMVCESSVTDEDSDFESHVQKSQSHKRPHTGPTLLTSGVQTHVSDEYSNDVIVKKIKQEIPEDYYIVANAELTGGIDGPTLALTQMPKSKSQTVAGPSYVIPSKTTTHVVSSHGMDVDVQSIPVSPSLVSRSNSQKSTRTSLTNQAKTSSGTSGSTQQGALQMPVSTSGASQQINIPLSALQLPGQEDEVVSEEDLVKTVPKQTCDIDLSSSGNAEPEVSSSQQQSSAAPSLATDASGQSLPDNEKEI